MFTKISDEFEDNTPNKFHKLDIEGLSISFQNKLRKQLEDNFDLTHAVYDENGYTCGNVIYTEFEENDSIVQKRMDIINRFNYYIEIDYNDLSKTNSYIFDKYFKEAMIVFFDNIILLSKNKKFFIAPPLDYIDTELYRNYPDNIINQCYARTNGVSVRFIDKIDVSTGVRSVDIDMLVGFEK